MAGLRRGQRGQGAIEYVGLVMVVVAIIGALVATGIGAELTEKIGAQVCRIGGGGDCGGGGGNPEAQGSPGDGEPVTDDGSPKSQSQIDYDAALKELQDARAAEKTSSDKALEAAKELAKILAEELGITDALDCITKGDMGACTETLINVLLSLVGGAVGKLAAKYGAPWKWKKAAKLIQALKKHGGDLYDGLKGLIKNRKKVKDAEKKLADAQKKLDAEKKDPPKKDPKDDKPPTCPAAHSFLPGTRVLLADGRRIGIEQVVPGAMVSATDPETGLSGAREVERLITTHEDKHFTRLVFRTPGGPAVVTATDTHPFWSVDARRWVDAGEIRPGAGLRTPDGTTLTVAAVGRYTQRQTTHDLTVAGIHTYYVVAGATPVLVHNNDPGCGVTAEALEEAWPTWNTPANLEHVIDPAKHGFGDLVAKAGGREQALRAIMNSLKGAKDLPAAGRYEVSRVIEGETVTIRGAIVNGVPRLGTAFIPGKFPG
ncbi:Hint domain-containing protein [Streptomyces sp. NBC_01185]|uniref:Hint domain-containing protein n=1 Tax=Streptomyces sp. NBC_01185 TaxID=2903764 RepID=UPI003865E4A1|nr:Hint domain-containing protein [Streptomyces sp. NBC_01185]